MGDRAEYTSARLRETARRIFRDALANCSVEQAFERKLQCVAQDGAAWMTVDGDEVARLDLLRRVRIVAAGKAAPAMLAGLLPRLTLPADCDARGVLIAAERPLDLPAGFQYFQGGHPVPNRESFNGAAAALAMLRQVDEGAAGLRPEETLCIFLISGGASAMMELPLDESISLEDTVALYAELVHCGASIVEINCVRKHFSAVKGGRLALAAGGAPLLTLLVSDVPPGRLDALASGPTLADTTTAGQCRDILARYGLIERLPESLRRYFAAEELAETPKPGDFVSPAYTLLDSDALAESARRLAEDAGFHAVIDNTPDDWSYDRAADLLLDRLRRLRQEHPRCAVISTGEVLVRVQQESVAACENEPSPVGGRNQHFALYVATRLAGDDGPIAILSAGSDGIDGNSPAAGAVVDEATVGPGKHAGAMVALEQFRSHAWLDGVGATIVTGATGHNLRDLRILLACEPRQV
jgi:glycerate 2-kinase